MMMKRIAAVRKPDSQEETPPRSSVFHRFGGVCSIIPRSNSIYGKHSARLLSEKFSLMNREARHPAPFLDLLACRLTREPGLPAIWRVKSFQRGPARSPIVAANLCARNRAAVKFPVIDDQRVNLRSLTVTVSSF